MARRWKLTAGELSHTAPVVVDLSDLDVLVLYSLLVATRGELRAPAITAWAGDMLGRLAPAMSRARKNYLHDTPRSSGDLMTELRRAQDAHAKKAGAHG